MRYTNRHFTYLLTYCINGIMYAIFGGRGGSILFRIIVQKHRRTDRRSLLLYHLALDGRG